MNTTNGASLHPTSSKRKRGGHLYDPPCPSASGCGATLAGSRVQRSCDPCSAVPPLWSWSTGDPGPSYSPFGGVLDSPLVIKHAGLQNQLPPPSPPTSQPTMTRDLPHMDHDHDLRYIGPENYQLSPTASSGLLSPLSLSHGFESDLEPFHKDQYQSVDGWPPYGGEVRVAGETSSLIPDEIDLFPMPFGWQASPCSSIFSGSFSDESDDSDDGLSASTLSSPETNSDPGEEEDGSPRSPAYLSSPTTDDQPIYHPIDSYPHPHLKFYPDDDDGELPRLSLSFSSTSPLALSPSEVSHSSLPPLDPHHDEQEPRQRRGESEQDQSQPEELSTRSFFDPPLSPLSPSSSISTGGAYDVGLSPSMPLASLPALFDDELYSPYPYDDFLSISAPDSPSRRRSSKDLPAMEIDELSSSPSTFGDFAFHHGSDSDLMPLFSNAEFPSSDGPSQRTTWLSLPGADTDDDLIPADLASPNYIPEPGLAIQTTPPVRSLLIWDPTTKSGLPAHLPVFDGTSTRSRRHLDANDVPKLERVSSSEENALDKIDPAELAEKGEEVQKLYELRQRTTAAANAAALAGRNREGTQWEAERVRERWRELTALLRLKLKLDEKVVGGAGEDGAKLEEQSSKVESVESLALSSTPFSAASDETMVDDSASESTTSMTPRRAASLPTPLISSSALTTTPPPSRRSSSKQPKITSMAQLVASMVFHRQQDALRRGPIRNRTWSAPACTELASSGGGGGSTLGVGANGKGKLFGHATPRSPLRQMILPGDVGDDDDGSAGGGGHDGVNESGESPLQLSPLCLCASPEGFYTQLEGSHAEASA